MDWHDSERVYRYVNYHHNRLGACRCRRIRDLNTNESRGRQNRIFQVCFHSQWDSINIYLDNIKRFFFFFRMDPDPFLRNSFWTVSIGNTLYLIYNLGIHRGSVQRFVSWPTYKKAGKSLIFFAIGMCVVKMLTGGLGMLMYAKYKDCDPVMANVSV